MVKTGLQIEGDFYLMVRESALGKAIHGEVYRPDMRPRDAQTEDIVVRFLDGLDTQIQKGVVVVNIYVPDIIRADGERVRDMKRIEELEQLVLQFITDDTSDYWIATESTPKLIHHKEIDQYLLNVRLEYQWVSM